MIRIDKLSLKAGAFILNDISIDLPTGSHVTLMGKTGCGKTSILESVCGLRKIVSGKIFLDEEDVTHFPPGDRGIGYVPQDLALFPTHTVKAHLEFALRIRKMSEQEIQLRIADLAKLLDITTLLDRTPYGLSGGESQRVALGRALSFRPRFLCLDEPMAALDDQTRDEIYDLIRKIRSETGVTIFHVTHSLAEAEALSDQIIKLEKGALQTIRAR